jgi:hypothetical protein
MQEDASPQASSSHMMKTTKRGRPFLKARFSFSSPSCPDLFSHPGHPRPLRNSRCFSPTHNPQAILSVVSKFFLHVRLLIPLPPPYSIFFLFPYSLASDEAAANLASLKFSQSNRGPDPREPSRVITTTTTTTFSMTRDMAKAMSQHFMDARLIENAADPSSNLFKDRGVYQLTPKGLHVLERFISRNGINGDHLSHVFATQPICMKLLHLERRSVDDEIIVSQSVITALFRRFVGRQTNYPPQAAQAVDPTTAYHERAKGIQLMDMTDRQPSSTGRSQLVTHRHCFAALAALEWLCDFSSVVGREEAAEMAAQFVRFGLITLVSDKRKNNDSAIIFTVRGSAPGGNSPVSVSGLHLSLFQSGPNFLMLSLPNFILFYFYFYYYSKRVNFGAQPKRSTRLRMKACERHAGTVEQSAARTRPPAQRQTSVLPSVLPLIGRAAPLKACRPLMPRFIGGYHLPRSSMPLTRARPQQIDGQRRAIRSGCNSSSTIRRCAISFVIIYGRTFARRILHSGSRFKTSNASSILPRPPAVRLSSGRYQNDCQAVRVTRLASRRWNSITSPSSNKRI